MIFQPKLCLGVLICLLLAACVPAATGKMTPAVTPPVVGQLPMERGKFFSGSGACAYCHTNLVDASGASVAIDSSWRSSMLANAARDPYWLATVRSEVIQAPELQSVIQKKCTACHMPMAALSALNEPSEVSIVDQGFVSVSHPLHSLAMDGVSCTFCHQLSGDNFGQAESFSGGHHLDLNRAPGERPAFGPYVVGKNLVTVMQAASGFIPMQGNHLAQSEACASCHNLITPFVDKDGQVVGDFPEQMIYSEWANSAYKDQKSCQACHMPLAQGTVQVSITGGPPRSPFYQHVFAGGNVFMGRIFQKNAAALQLSASPEQFETTLQQAARLLEKQTASLAVENAHLQAGRLQADLVVQTRTGHKFPAGYPSRRAWLHIILLDKDRQILFESGAVRPDGSITGNDQDADGLHFEPHYTRINTPDQVQIYEAILLDTDERVTTSLLRAARYRKDNRLLPVGFDLQRADATIAVAGEATRDPDFQPSGDRVALQVPVDPARGPFRLQVELLYQSIGYRWAENLRVQAHEEARAFSAYYASIPNLPAVVARLEQSVSP